MNRQEDELKQIFLAEASDNYEELNRLFTALEKNHADKSAIEEVFRITHTLKANAAAMGFDSIADLSHVLEDIFSLIKMGNMVLDTKTFNELFKANDKLGDLLEGIRQEKKVAYKGMLTKLKVILRNAKGTSAEENPTPSTEAKEEPAPQKGEVGLENFATETEELHSSPPEEAPIQQTQIAFSDLVQVPVKKLDALLNLVSELAIEKDRLLANSAQAGRANEFAALNRITSDLQYSVMGVRLVQVSVLFQKFHRIVRDVAKLENKQVNLVLEGTDIEIDRNVLQIISDSMVHLVRNAVSHGIELPTERAKAAKSPEGTITLRASNEKDNVIITVKDDGKGINPSIIRKKVIEKGLAQPELLQQLPDESIIKYIFEPGFSSAESVTAVSGRGVGMDVVRRVTEAIGGKVSIKSEIGQGTVIQLSLPSSMAVKSALLFELATAEFCIPLSFTEAVISVSKSQIHKVGNGLVTSHLEQTIPVVFLKDLFRVQTLEELQETNAIQRGLAHIASNDKVHIIVVSVEGKMLGFVVDKLLQQKEIIEKPLAPPVENIHFISGATILGNGNVCLVLDVPDIADFLFNPVQVGKLAPVV